MAATRPRRSSSTPRIADPTLLRRTAELAIEFLESLDERPVAARADRRQLLAALGGPLPDDGAPPLEVIEDLVAGADDGIVAIPGPRYFGFVIGGSLPAALAADWLTSTWDQNSGIYAAGPAASVVEEVVGDWLVDLLGLPAGTSVGLTTGCQMAHFACLAAARHAVLERFDWDVEAKGLFGAPEITVVVGAEAHATIPTALQFLGLGRTRVVEVACDEQGRMRLEALGAALPPADGPLIVVLQAGNVNTGSFDPLRDAIELVRERCPRAWIHIDGAFGLWAAADPERRHLLDGHDGADSWATDGHKWLNVPYDCGFAIVRDRVALRSALSSFAGAEYIPPIEHGERYNAEWVPEFSRRARGFAAYAAIRSLGRSGIAGLVDRCCANARLMAKLLGELDGIEVLNDVTLNQVLVRVERDGKNVSEEVVQAVQDEGTCWMSGSTWNGAPTMRISIVNCRTTEDDVQRSAGAIASCCDQALIAS